MGTQKGFMHGRQLVQHAVDLDHRMRAVAFCHRGSREDGGAWTIQISTEGIAAALPFGGYAILVLHPSVGHAWLLLGLKIIKFWIAYFWYAESL